MTDDNYLFITKDMNGYIISQTTQKRAYELFNEMKDNKFGYKCLVAKLLKSNKSNKHKEQIKKVKTKGLMEL